MSGHRHTEYRMIMAATALLCGLAALCAVFPAARVLVDLAFGTAAVLAILAITARWTARHLRERREDREDARTAAAWRAQHRPVAVP